MFSIIHRAIYTAGENFHSLLSQATDIYSFNILIIITLLYHMYIEYEIYNFSYNKRKIILNKNLFIKGTMDKWDDDVTPLKIVRRRGY